MLEVETDGTQTLVRINASSLGVIQACPRKSKYKLHEGWSSRYGAPAQIYGTAIHKALEVFYTHSGKDRDFPQGFYESAMAMAIGEPAPSDHFLFKAVKAFIETGAPLQNGGDDKRSIESGIWTLCHYFKTYQHDPYVGVHTEHSFTLPFWEDKRLKIELHGQIDLVLKNEVTGEELPGDHKTTSMMGREFLNRTKPCHQYTIYLWAAQKIFGLKTNNFLVNGIQVKAFPKTTRGGPPIFTRQITTRTEEDFAELSEVIIENVMNYLRWRHIDIWPLGDVNSCSMYGGCEFLDVCSSPNALKSNILEAKFQRS